MKTASLLLVFALAKTASLVGHHVPLSWWSPVAFFWQDALVVLIFAGADWLCRNRRGIGWAIYAATTAYVAFNIPVARVLSTPLTWLMWQAARGPLADSIWLYVTWQNVLWVVSVFTVAAVAPVLFRTVRQGPVVVALGLIVAIGPAAARHVETRGLDRNAWTALVATAMPRLESTSEVGDWHEAGFDRTTHEDLSRFSGLALGRNIVLVSLESTAAQYLGLYGASPDVMPNLSGLARSAIVFEHAYAVYPESIKGLFSVLCAIYPAFDSDAELYGKVPCRSIATMLSGAGYRTALFHSGRFVYLGMEGVIRGRGFETLADAGDIGGNHNSSFGVDEPATVARMLHWIDAAPSDTPFFVAYLPIAGHHPYETPAPGPVPDRDELGRYLNALHYGDESLGALRRGLQERGLDERTVWIVIGDHGEAFGQHEGNFGHTFFLYEENVHVPFLIAAPGRIRQPIRTDRVVSLIDTAPTLLDLAGVQPPIEYQGRSVLNGEPRMARFFADYSLGLLGLRDGPVKFIDEVESGRSTLFDLEADPKEQTNTIDAYADRARWYREELRRWAASQKHLLAGTASR